MNMNELNEEELDMVNGGSLWSTIKKAVTTAAKISYELKTASRSIAAGLAAVLIL